MNAYSYVSSRMVCDGHWDGMIRSGDVKMVIERIQAIFNNSTQVACRRSSGDKPIITAIGFEIVKISLRSTCSYSLV